MGFGDTRLIIHTNSLMHSRLGRLALFLRCALLASLSSSGRLLGSSGLLGSAKWLLCAARFSGSLGLASR